MTYLNSLNQILQTLSKLKWWLIALLFIGFISYIFRQPIIEMLNPKSEVEQGINQSQLVNNVLRQMMEEYRGDRAYVYRFHNGVNYYDGSHKIKSSMDFEVVANGIQPIGLFMQDIPTSLFADQMSAIINEDVLGISLDETQDKAASSVMVEFGVSHSAALPFYDKRGHLIMVIGIDWVNKDSISFIESRFRLYVNKIGRMLTNQPSNDIVNIRDPRFHRTRGNEAKQIAQDLKKEPAIRVGFCADYVKSKRSRLLQVIADAD